ncbi:MAG: bifunctional nuclease family protein [Muribaculaceae bacterium]|nr:bifunctional nuclease family protein [Muribaculaceae bacterium]
MENELVRLNIVGITYNQIENGMYAMVLEDEDGRLRLPIIIGYNEAQSIECLLQKIKTPRPLTHEFTTEILDSFNIVIESVIIKQLDNGIFTGDVTLCKGSDRHVLDARSSDAIALAMRTNAPIYTAKSLLEKCGVEKDSMSTRNPNVSSRHSIPAQQAIERVKRPEVNKYDDTSEIELLTMMEQAVKEEDYEKAAEIKLEIEKRRGALESNA